MSPRSSISSFTRAAWRRLPLSIGLATLVSATPALAHPRHSAGLLAGLIHPLTGVDHLLAMLASGLWAGTIGGSMRWGGPAAFLIAMISGALLGLGGIALPAGALVIGCMVTVFGVLIAARVRPTPILALPIFTLAGAWHGNAHGLEAEGGSLAFLAGMLLSTILLHAIGLFAATRREQVMISPVIGVAIASGGVAILAG